eukprot:TRINITY_DN7712_c0_g1_i2.p1 TRINITY_DN7712_c0_g1~~TRINITY_DN7712_c0_g1_i2.p1  ORF type:complete len:973 (+),score=184.69 TRINITY_DN7712_c0_g1_i2:54-2972(+)
MQGKPCTLLINNDKVEETRLGVLKKRLEDGSDQEKCDTMQHIILMHLNGEKMPQLIMTIIRFVLPSKNKRLKKLLLLFWEIAEKTDSEGKLLHEMILICDALRRDLISPNEYVRGSTLRFLCKLREPELLEPLIPAIVENLTDRYSYVRRNAVLCIYTVYKNFPDLIPDGPERIFEFLSTEPDPTCKRNAFIMLFNCDQDRAIEYLSTVLDQVADFGDILQFIIVELIRKVCKTNPAERSKYLRCVFTLLNSSSPAVQFESANTLVSLTGAPTAIRAAASTFIKLLCEQSDNNVKMIVLDRIEHIMQHHTKVMQSLVMDLLRALVSTNMDVRRKTLHIAMQLVSPANVEEVVHSLKKEINKTQSSTVEKTEAGTYREMLIRAIHQCAVQYPVLAGAVVNVLMDFIGDSSVQSAIDVVTFVREVMETYPDLRAEVLNNLLESLHQIKSAKVYRAALWIVGEYALTTEDIDLAFTSISEELGDVPFRPNKAQSEDEAEDEDGEEGEKAQRGGNAKGVLNADGTYASQSVFSEKEKILSVETGSEILSLRSFILTGDFFLSAVLATTLTKLVLRSFQSDIGEANKNAFSAKVTLILVGLLKIAQLRKRGQALQAGSNEPATEENSLAVDADSLSRVWLCVKILVDKDGSYDLQKDILLNDCRESFAGMLREKLKEDERRLKEQKAKTNARNNIQADNVLKIRQLNPKRDYGGEELYDMDDLYKVTGFQEEESGGLRLDRLVQLTGMSDPVYAEAFVLVHRFDIVLEVMIKNQTEDTLQNLSLELATFGDLKLCERPQNHTIGPMQSITVKANIKVSSTDTGIIFGSISYDVAGSTYSNCVILNEIHVDIMDYISPATCTEHEFRTMWSDFEWENKLAVNTNILDIREYLDHIISITNMNCLTSPKAREGDCSFLSANLYAKSVFGEDALANLSIESNLSTGKIDGFIRIRSKTQGIALSLGDRISVAQKKATDNH